MQSALYTGEVSQRLNIVFHERLGCKKKQLLHTILKRSEGIRKAWNYFYAPSSSSLPSVLFTNIWSKIKIHFTLYLHGFALHLLLELTYSVRVT